MGGSGERSERRCLEGVVVGWGLGCVDGWGVRGASRGPSSPFMSVASRHPNPPPPAPKEKLSQRVRLGGKRSGRRGAVFWEGLLFGGGLGSLEGALRDGELGFP
jgi:hypothetical protein